MEQPQRNASPGFYKNAAILFYLFGGILVFMAIVRRDWVYGAFGGITLLNAMMTTIKLRHMRETGK
jgi:drug/metabolite transporter superfamily protein YnfA